VLRNALRFLLPSVSFISNDKKYLFSPYSSDINGLTVFDLVNNKLLYSSDTVRGYISTFYLYNNKYFAVIENDEKKQNETEIITFNFQTNDLIYSTVDSNFVNNADKLKGYNILHTHLVIVDKEMNEIRLLINRTLSGAQHQARSPG
jgi:hypothetical protein